MAQKGEAVNLQSDTGQIGTIWVLQGCHDNVLITLPGQKGNLLSINLAFFFRAKIPIMLKEDFFASFLIRTALHSRNHAIAKRYIFSIV